MASKDSRHKSMSERLRRCITGKSDYRYLAATAFQRLTDSARMRITGKKSDYGYARWDKADHEWYEEIHCRNPVLHGDFWGFLGRSGARTVLEVGCGTGVYPIRHPELFEGVEYTGLDISESNTAYCRANSPFSFIAADVIKMPVTQRYDLVYSHAVIDHVYDVNGFLSKLLDLSQKHVYISSYRGYFPDLKKHKMKWNDRDGCYYTDVSVGQVERFLMDYGLSRDEFKTRRQQADADGERYHLVIEVEKSLA